MNSDNDHDMENPAPASLQRQTSSDSNTRPANRPSTGMRYGDMRSALR